MSRLRNDSRKPDTILLIVGGMLLGIGLITLFSASSLYGKERFGDLFYFFKRQLLFGVLPGLIVGYAAYRTPLTIFRRLCAPLFFLSLVLMAFVFVPSIGISLGGATRWIELGTLRFQPSEILKLTTILYFAAFLMHPSTKSMQGKKTIQDNGFPRFIMFLVTLGVISLLLFFQPDAGTLGIILITSALLYFVSRTSLLQVGALGGLLIAFALFLAQSASYRIDRVLAFLHPKSDPLGIGYQINQILVALGSGGIAGLGIGMSQQKFGFIPQPVGDSIFAIYGEEFGFIGTVFLITLFLIFLVRGLMIAVHTKDEFARLVACGISCWIPFQAFINIGGMSGLIPLTGVPLPFFSYGGTAMVVTLIATGILFNISRHRE